MEICFALEARTKVGREAKDKHHLLGKEKKKKKKISFTMYVKTKQKPTATKNPKPLVEYVSNAMHAFFFLTYILHV